MKIPIIKISVFFFAFFISFNVMAGGGWPQPKGKAYLKLSEWWTIANQHYTSQGLIDPNVTTGIFNTSIYAEYGFTDRVTGILYFPVFSRTYFNNLVSNTTQEIITPGEALNSVGDADIAIKYGLNKPGQKFAFAATLKLGLPLGNASGGTQGNLQTGDGEFNQLIQFDAGTGINIGEKNTLYANAYAGFNNRTNDFSDEVRLGLEAGLGLLEKRLWLIGRLDILKSLKNGATAAESTTTSIFANNTEFTSIGGEINYYVTKKFGLSVGAATAVAGQIILAKPSYTVGVFLDLK